MVLSGSESIAQGLVTTVRQNTPVDWDKKEQARALVPSRINGLLIRHRRPPDKQEPAIVLVMDQPERFAAEAAT
jgi:type I restriction enzyme R subunit